MKNLVSTTLLIINGFKCVFVLDKFLISTNVIYIAIGYFNKGLFKHDVMIVEMIKLRLFLT